jgi:putative PIG3 family NAD(P)H quinone oxidoreductase
MRAAISENGALTWVERPTPEPGPGQVRIRVHASAANRADLVQVAGRYPPPKGATDILGLECAGSIDAVGAGVDRQVGERVAALLVGGGYGEYVLCPAAHLLDVPDHVSLEQAAALPEVWVTAWLNLVREGGLAAGEHVLLHAGASGVGTAGIQLCRMHKAKAWVVVGSEDKLKRCQALGASGGVNRHEQDWAAHVAQWTDNRGLDLILDPVGADTVAKGITALGNRGRLVLIGLMSGREATIPLAQVLVKRVRIQGSGLRGRSDAEKTELLSHFRTDVWPHLMSGVLQGVVDSVFPMTKVADAHDHMRTNTTVGKLVLSWV